jgi:hypothetical protein
MSYIVGKFSGVEQYEKHPEKAKEEKYCDINFKQHMIIDQDNFVSVEMPLKKKMLLKN